MAVVIALWLSKLLAHAVGTPLRGEAMVNPALIPKVENIRRPPTNCE